MQKELTQAKKDMEARRVRREIEGLMSEKSQTISQTKAEEEERKQKFLEHGDDEEEERKAASLGRATKKKQAEDGELTSKGTMDA